MTLILEIWAKEELRNFSKLMILPWKETSGDHLLLSSCLIGFTNGIQFNHYIIYVWKELVYYLWNSSITVQKIILFLLAFLSRLGRWYWKKFELWCVARLQHFLSRFMTSEFKVILKSTLIALRFNCPCARFWVTWKHSISNICDN